MTTRWRKAPWMAAGVAMVLGLLARPPCRAEDPARAGVLAEDIFQTTGISAGLCVHVGCRDALLTAALAGNGGDAGGAAFLVHGIDPDPRVVDEARRILRARRLYGRAWVECRATRRLPYAENLVNLLVVDDLPRIDLSIAEILRVLVPGGAAWIGQDRRWAQGGDALRPAALKRRLEAAGAEIVERGGCWALVRKPWPEGMGQWSHPRHGAGGNAASKDTLVGVPKRIRWVAGPSHEVSNMIADGGRIFHAGLLARDAFNGLRLWKLDLDPTPMRLGYPASAVEGSVLPVASRDLVFVVERGELQARGAGTGRLVRTYGKVSAPREILHVEGKLLVLEADGVRCLDVQGGDLLWSHAAQEPSGFVAAEGGLFLLEGSPRRGKNRAIVKLALRDGKDIWRRNEHAWAARVQRFAATRGLLVCEASTFNNDRPGNAIHALSTRDGREIWHRSYEPGMSHYVQARAIRVGDTIWILHAGRWEGLDPRTGKTIRTLPGGSGHCYPPVATARYLIAGELDLTDIRTGRYTANRITKGACGRDAGFLPANGLIYCAPKHCSCWPMVAGYVAMAPARRDNALDHDAEGAALETAASSRAASRSEAPVLPQGAEWPSYRADARRSGSTPGPVPVDLDVVWSLDLGDWPRSPLVHDWKEDLYVSGPVTPPVVAAGTAIVARPDSHQVVAVDALTGARRWDFTASGRVDTPPTIARGLCIFGTRSGFVVALRMADGRPAWRLRVAPHEERIVSFGQLESPWPVPGSVLVLDGTAYVAAGRHPLADGGVRVLALDPQTGKILWRRRVDSLPLEHYYGGAGLEVDPFDLLAAENVRPETGDPPGKLCISMSRWRFDPRTGKQSIAYKSGFAFHSAGGAGVVVSRGFWTYGPRMDYIPSGPRPGHPDRVHANRRPLAVFRGNALFASSDDKHRVFGRWFSAAAVRQFNDEWYNQRQVPRRRDAPGDRSRSDRLAHGAKWTVEAFASSAVGALVLAGDRLLAAGAQGGLLVLSCRDGSVLARRPLPPPVWDGMAAAYGRLYVATRRGKLLCLGRPSRE